jgi:KDO2-lipid IV(A) lauroyltransferase
VGLLPHRFLYYVLADAIYFVVYKLAHYRVTVVRNNLSSSFPEKGYEELRAIERGYYHNLSEYFVDAISMASITPRRLLKRVHWPAENRIMLNEIAGGRNWIALLGHYGSWEILNAYGLYNDSAAMASVYHHINNKAFDMYYYKVRNRLEGLHSVEMKEVLRFYVGHQAGIDGRALSIALVADQNATIDAQSRWVRFLNHPTVFFHGGEKIARKFGLPVFYMHVTKRGRGLWEQNFELMWDGVSPTSDYEITGMYSRMLEEDIRRYPELWLWSHRRWKRNPHGEEARRYNEQYETDIPE